MRTATKEKRKAFRVPDTIKGKNDPARCKSSAEKRKFIEVPPSNTTTVNSGNSDFTAEKRKFFRVPSTLTATLTGDNETFNARVVDISKEGMCLMRAGERSFSSGNIDTLVIDDLEIDGESMDIVWEKADGGSILCGIRVQDPESDIGEKMDELVTKVSDKHNRILQNRLKDYDDDFIAKRRNWVESYANTPLEEIGNYTISSESMRGNIENLIGTCQVPVGVAGPVRVLGKYAKGDFLVPLATTEGALVKTYNRGMRLILKAGGANVRILRNEIHISPAFFVNDIIDAEEFINWTNNNFSYIKEAAEKTTSHGRLVSIVPVVMGRKVVLKMSYYTQDAQGLNMINTATFAACQYIAEHTGKKFIHRSDYSAIKKVSTSNFHEGQGKSVFADITIPRDMLRLLQTTPEAICNYQETWKYAKTFCGMSGMNIHVANLLSAVFIACGQDPADVAMSHVGILICETVETGDLYAGLYLPNLLVGTVGGGTSLGTQKECLNMLGCYGQNKAEKFAEIIAVAALAGELACNAALDNRTYVNAHENYGRNR